MGNAILSIVAFVFIELLINTRYAGSINAAFENLLLVSGQNRFLVGSHAFLNLFILLNAIFVFYHNFIFECFEGS